METMILISTVLFVLVIVVWIRQWFIFKLIKIDKCKNSGGHHWGFVRSKLESPPFSPNPKRW